MKKILAALIVAFLMSAGLVAATATSAQAAPCPYTGCIQTKTTGNAKQINKRPHRARTSFRVTTDGNATPRGSVRVTLKGNAKFRSRTFRSLRGRVVFTGLPFGSYVVTIRFRPAQGSPFRASEKETVVTLNSPRRR